MAVAASPSFDVYFVAVAAVGAASPGDVHCVPPMVCRCSGVVQRGQRSAMLVASSSSCCISCGVRLLIFFSISENGHNHPAASVKVFLTLNLQPLNLGFG